MAPQSTAVHSKAVAEGSLLLVLAVLIPLFVSKSSAQDATFCRALIRSSSQCPVVPTVEEIDLNHYTGRWFEIGTDAQFAFSYLGQQGGQCATANYTFLGNVNQQNNIRVVNRALVVNSQRRVAQSFSISQSAASVGLGVRVLCNLLVEPEAQVQAQNPITITAQGQQQQPATTAQAQPTAQDLLHQFQQAQNLNQLGSAFKTSAQVFVNTLSNAPGNMGKSVLALATEITAATMQSTALDLDSKNLIIQEVAKVQMAVNSASVSLSQIFATLEAIQRLNFVLSGGTLPAPYFLPNTVAGIVQRSQQVQALTGQLARARQQILVSSQVIQRTADGKDSQVFRRALALSTMSQGLVSSMALTITNIGNGAQAIRVTARSVRIERVAPRVITSVGSAVQNQTQAGALTVSFLGPPVGLNNYKIIKLDGEAAQGYQMALVYSCSDDVSTAFMPRSTAFLLSRTPTVPIGAVQAAMVYLRQQGILFAGDNPFVVISQNARLCRPVTSLP